MPFVSLPKRFTCDRIVKHDAVGRTSSSLARAIELDCPACDIFAAVTDPLRIQIDETHLLLLFAVVAVLLVVPVAYHWQEHCEESSSDACGRVVLIVGDYGSECGEGRADDVTAERFDERCTSSVLSFFFACCAFVVAIVFPLLSL